MPIPQARLLHVALIAGAARQNQACLVDMSFSACPSCAPPCDADRLASPPAVWSAGHPGPAGSSGHSAPSPKRHFDPATVRLLDRTQARRSLQFVYIPAACATRDTGSARPSERDHRLYSACQRPGNASPSGTHFHQWRAGTSQ